MPLAPGSARVVVSENMRECKQFPEGGLLSQCTEAGQQEG
jgi:hypothetical protein